MSTEASQSRLTADHVESYISHSLLLRGCVLNYGDAVVVRRGWFAERAVILDACTGFADDHDTELISGWTDPEQKAKHFGLIRIQFRTAFPSDAPISGHDPAHRYWICTSLSPLARRSGPIHEMLASWALYPPEWLEIGRNAFTEDRRDGRIRHVSPDHPDIREACGRFRLWLESQVEAHRHTNLIIGFTTCLHRLEHFLKNPRL